MFKSSNDDIPDPEADSSNWRNPSSHELEELLRSSKRIAVLGLSSNPARPSNGVAAYLQAQGYEIIPVNPKESEILGQKTYPDLASVPGKIDIVDVFRRSEFAPAIVEEAARIGARAVWLQEEVISPLAFNRGLEAGLTMIMDCCILKEHSRLLTRDSD